MSVWRTRKRGTPRQKGKRFLVRKPAKRPPTRFSMRVIHVVPEYKEPVVKAALNSVLRQGPFVKDLYMGYIIADSIFSNWSSVKELYSVCEKEGVEGITNLIGSNAVHNALFSAQTRIIWATIKTFIPREYQDIGKQVLANLIDQATSVEIEFVTRFLERSKNKEPVKNEFGARLEYLSAREQFASKYPVEKQKKKWPEEIRYV